MRFLEKPAAAYIHIPFCRSKCFYCDFNSYPGQEGIIEDYVNALVEEISHTPPALLLESVYFGGGTPTVVPAERLVDVLQTVVERLGVAPGAEITMEANPGTVTPDSLARLWAAGFNRLSLGVQSFDDEMLPRLGRIHTAQEAKQAFQDARNAGFGNVSIDLMYALPDQTVDEWKATLTEALSLRPEHVSLYELSVEEGTAFGNLQKRCALALPDEDRQIEMYRAAIDALLGAGYEHYEISNFSLPGRRSRHNQVYWRNEPYFGFGAGATGFVDGTRSTNDRLPAEYIRRVRKDGFAVATSESTSGRQAMGETVMLGLRMLDGVSLEDFRMKHGRDLLEFYKPEVEDQTAKGLLEIQDGRLKLTWDGLLLANEVSAEFL